MGKRSDYKKLDDLSCWDLDKGCRRIAIEASVPADAFKDAKLVEEIVMAWAAEHPEPVYPAWRDWLRDLYGNPNMTMTDILESPIDPEIAQRLNIVPRRTR